MGALTLFLNHPAYPGGLSAGIELRSIVLQVVLVQGSHVHATRGKVRVPGDRTVMQNCVKKPGAGLSNVANHKLWHGELFEDAACLGFSHTCMYCLMARRFLVGIMQIFNNTALDGTGGTFLWLCVCAAGGGSSLLCHR